MSNISVYDKMKKIFKENPENFEKEREKLIQEVIDGASPECRQKLIQLQWKIDAIRKTSKNPLDATIKISEMMWGCFLGEDGLVDNLEKLAQITDPSYQRQISRNKLIPSTKPKEKGKILFLKK